MYSTKEAAEKLGLSQDHVRLLARNGLIEKSLLAFDGFMFQVLSLPDKPLTADPKPLRATEDFETKDPFTIRQIIGQSMGGKDD